MEFITYRLSQPVILSVVSEGLPLVALEALQWGVPVIGSQNGCLTPPGDFRALDQRLGRMLDNPELPAELQAGAQASVDPRFSVDTCCRAIRRLVLDLIPLPDAVEADSSAAAQPCH